MWDVPFFKHSENWFVKNLLETGSIPQPISTNPPNFATVRSGLDSHLNGDSAGDRAIVNPGGDPHRGRTFRPHQCAGQVVATSPMILTARYIPTGLGAFGSAGRNTLPSHPINDFDMALVKKFSIRESLNLQFGVQAFNIFNHPQFVPGQLNNINLTSQTSTRNFLIPGTRNFDDFSSVFSSNPRDPPTRRPLCLLTRMKRFGSDH